MKLLDWINSQEKPNETKRLLQTYLARSASTVVSYIYGYRKVPTEMAEKISDFTNNEVTNVDLENQFKSFNENDLFVLAPSKGQRVGKPILCISKKTTQKDLDAFFADIKQVLEVKA